jgi:hypothetical protein
MIKPNAVRPSEKRQDGQGGSPFIDIDSVFREGTSLDRAVVASFAETVLRHRQTGTPLVIWRDGAVVEVPPDEMPIPNVDAVPQRKSNGR